MERGARCVAGGVRGALPVWQWAVVGKAKACGCAGGMYSLHSPCCDRPARQHEQALLAHALPTTCHFACHCWLYGHMHEHLLR